jgi:pseudouridine-5'-phosphate glycosidase
MGVVRTHPRVREALAAGKPVVGLETAVLTHGLPREPIETPECFIAPDALDAALHQPLVWDPAVPAHLQLSLLMSQAVRDGGAEPAVIAVVDGVLEIGLDENAVRDLAARDDATKASTRDLAALATTGGTAGTTVAASLLACTLASPKPIQTLATGGIGGVHRDWQTRPDISADLKALAKYPVAVVASGAKVILDLIATTEALDSLGIPVVGCKTSWFPRFTAGVDEQLPLAHRIDEPAAIARLCQTHWTDLKASSAVLVAHPCPAELVADSAALDRLVDLGLAEAAALGIDGGGVTPFLLGAIGRTPGVPQLSANIALLLSNAAQAARIATAMSMQPID